MGLRRTDIVKLLELGITQTGCRRLYGWNTMGDGHREFLVVENPKDGRMVQAIVGRRFVGEHRGRYVSMLLSFDASGALDGAWVWRNRERQVSPDYIVDISDMDHLPIPQTVLGIIEGIGA